MRLFFAFVAARDAKREQGGRGRGEGHNTALCVFVPLRMFCS